jgi:hypothetical protein
MKFMQIFHSQQPFLLLSGSLNIFIPRSSDDLLIFFINQDQDLLYKRLLLDRPCLKINRSYTVNSRILMAKIRVYFSNIDHSKRK